MAGRCTRMDAPILPQHLRHGAAYRNACLVLGALCLLAALAVPGARSGTTVHHRSHVLAAATFGSDLQGASHRAGVDAVPAGRAAARISTARLAASAGAVPEPRRPALDTIRTRGPPAAA